jgi:hypothetical protein
MPTSIIGGIIRRDKSLKHDDKKKMVPTIHSLNPTEQNISDTHRIYIHDGVIQRKTPLMPKNTQPMQQTQQTQQIQPIQHIQQIKQTQPIQQTPKIQQTPQIQQTPKIQQTQPIQQTPKIQQTRQTQQKKHIQNMSDTKNETPPFESKLPELELERNILEYKKEKNTISIIELRRLTYILSVLAQERRYVLDYSMISDDEKKKIFASLSDYHDNDMMIIINNIRDYTDNINEISLDELNLLLGFITTCYKDASILYSFQKYKQKLIDIFIKFKDIIMKQNYNINIIDNNHKNTITLLKSSINEIGNILSIPIEFELDMNTGMDEDISINMNHAINYEQMMNDAELAQRIQSSSYDSYGSYGSSGSTGSTILYGSNILNKSNKSPQLKINNNISENEYMDLLQLEDNAEIEEDDDNENEIDDEIEDNDDDKDEMEDNDVMDNDKIMEDVIDHGMTDEQYALFLSKQDLFS